MHSNFVTCISDADKMETMMQCKKNYSRRNVKIDQIIRYVEGVSSFVLRARMHACTCTSVHFSVQANKWDISNRVYKAISLKRQIEPMRMWINCTLVAVPVTAIHIEIHIERKKSLSLQKPIRM